MIRRAPPFAIPKAVWPRFSEDTAARRCENQRKANISLTQKALIVRY